jgi:hypothetical protein
MGQALGVTKNYIYLIESEKNKPGKKFILKLDRFAESRSKILDSPRPTSLIEEKTINEEAAPYRIRRMIWIEADNEKLEALLHEYAIEKDWGAVKEITTELLNRKITNKLKENP